MNPTVGGAIDANRDPCDAANLISVHVGPLAKSAS